MFGNPVQGPRIVPFASPRTSKDYLPNNHLGFRVTQRFNDWDAFFHNRIHGAMDIANFACGDVVLAMERGRAVHILDPNGALGIRIEHPNGWETEVWHLSSRLVASGAQVNRGQVIGRVGSTGLSIAGCHVHVVAKGTNGIPVDIWPLLDQNITQLKYVSVSAGANIRADKYATSALVKHLTVETKLPRAGAITTGGSYTYLKDGQWVVGNKWLPVTYSGVKRFVILPFARAA